MKAFRNRIDAGRQLAEQLHGYASHSDVITLALPQGGVPVAYEVALSLGVPLDVLLAAKLGVPWQEDLAMGAIAAGGVRILNDRVVQTLGISEETIQQTTLQKERELERREQIYRRRRPLPRLRDRTVILIDDGLATGSTMRAAVAAVRRQGARVVVVAVPVAAITACEIIRCEVDEVICARTPDPFFGIGNWYFALGNWYEDFLETTDGEVLKLLQAAATSRSEADRLSPPLANPAPRVGRPVAVSP